MHLPQLITICIHPPIFPPVSKITVKSHNLWLPPSYIPPSIQTNFVYNCKKSQFVTSKITVKSHKMWLVIRYKRSIFPIVSSVGLNSQRSCHLSRVWHVHHRLGTLATQQFLTENPLTRWWRGSVWVKFYFLNCRCWRALGRDLSSITTPTGGIPRARRPSLELYTWEGMIPQFE